MMPETGLRIALLIDGDNAQPSLIPPILEALGHYGRCVIRRVYGDWTASNMSGWRKVEEAHAIQLVQQSRYTTGKNATDIAITIAAMEILHSGKVDAFCIVSSDSDFTPLVVRLKDEGATVIAVGKPTTPQSFVNACSVFIATDTLNNAQKPSTKAALAKKNTGSPATPPDARPLLQKAYEMTHKTDEWVYLSELGQSLRKIDPKFKTKTYGQKALSHLVAQYLDVFEVRTEKGKGKTSRMYVKLKAPEA
jgi:uncharacterized protein (TIGR00288 family)